MEGGKAVKIAGTMEWANNTAKLELHDAFEPIGGVIYGLEDADPYPVIHGETTGSDLVSLLKILPVGRRFAVGGAGLKEAQSFISSWCVIGAHVDEQTRYEELCFRIPGLPVWLNNGGVTLDYQSGPGARVAYEFAHTPEEQVSIPSRAIKIGFEVQRTFPWPTDTEFTVKSQGQVRICPDEPQTLEWLLDELSKTTTLLSLLAGAPMLPDLVTAKIAGGRPVHVLIGPWARQHHIFTSHHHVFMLRTAMGTSLADALARWYDIVDKIELPARLALSILNSADLWTHMEFLSLMQALEGLHRALMPGLYVPADEYSKIAGTLNSAIPLTVQSDHRDSLKGRIKYGNEYSLRKRLKALIDPLPISIRKLVLGGPSLPGRWVDTRNYYTHWDETARSSALNEVDMHRAGVRMKLLLRVLYLQLVGVPEPSLLTALNGANRDSQYLLQLNGLQHRQAAPGSTAGALGQITCTSSASAAAADASHNQAPSSPPTGTPIQDKPST
ncbi:hypothetical protein CJO86_13890 [Ralstonia solanacearum]|nr:hypothetical protein CJO86_13890 [Ralstonia solanacearum]